MPANRNRPFYLDGSLQHYAWGGYNYLYNFLSRGNPARQPAAEIWYGAHPKSPSTITSTDGDLLEVIQQDPVRMLNPQVAGRFRNRLPFLLKLLDVREMLSIQVHPDKSAAEDGFNREEERGIPADAADRNYRDDNHKPELGVALTDFYLLHGFRSASEIESTLLQFTSWHRELLPILTDQGVRGLYNHIMRADQPTVDRLLKPLADLVKRKPSQDPTTPPYWVERAIKRYTHEGHHDRGMFSLFWLNLVHLRPGEGIFQDAGVPHAYLQGTCIEVMANSDNVLRGGLTPKHVDVPELLRHIRTDAVTPRILFPQVSGDEEDWDDYKAPAPDFGLQVIKRKSGSFLYLEDDQGPSILLLTEGRISDHRYNIQLDQRQRAVFVPAGVQIEFEVHADCVVYRAMVGEDGLNELAIGLGHHVSDT